MPAARPLRARRRSFPAALPAVLLTVLLMAAGCAPDTGVRVSGSQEIPQGATIQAEPVGGAPDEPFSAEDIRWLIVDADLSSLGAQGAGAEEVLLYCEECLEFGDPVVIDGEKMQLVTVTSPQVGLAFAGFAVAEDDGEPVITLKVAGAGLHLHPGSGRTVVAEESVYAEGDAMCCPSGWSVRVFRYQNGRFEAGQRITSMDET